MSTPAMQGSTGVLVINFGEPDEPTRDQVEPFLERIFLQNAGLEPDQAARERARKLAQERAEGLIDEYRRIGGSPLNDQATAQARALQEELRTRGWDARSYMAFQFTRPFIGEAVRRARADGVDRLIALPVYPMCGRSTTVAALADVRSALMEIAWEPAYAGLAGWHHDSRYARVWAESIRAFTETEGVDLSDADTMLYFSAHGTPIKYLDEGNRYDRYVAEHCRDIARRLGVERYAVGFQNHTNRRIRWTQPDNEECLRGTEEKRVVVVPISFMHEQSETLFELDHEVREFAESLGKEFYRVPVPHDAPDFVAFLADLVVEAATGSGELSRCRCAPFEGAWCTNGHRDLPPSPYVEVESGRPAATGVPTPG